MGALPATAFGDQDHHTATELPIKDTCQRGGERYLMLRVPVPGLRV